MPRLGTASAAMIDAHDNQLLLRAQARMASDVLIPETGVALLIPQDHRHDQRCKRLQALAHKKYALANRRDAADQPPMLVNVID